MLQTQIGSGFQATQSRRTGLARKPGRRWVFVLALALLGESGMATTGSGQTPSAGSSGVTASTVQPAAANVTSMHRFVPRDNLILCVDFDGLDAHAEAWQKTAAYKMLNQTPLGIMLEEVAAQLLDKFLESVPGRKVSGVELVTLVKHMARKGWVVALNANQKGTNPFVGTLVLRGATATKEIKAISSRVLGTVMGADAKPKVDRKEGRVMVVIPPGTGTDSGWVWWPEKDDLIVGFMQPSNADTIIAVLDGKIPSAAEHANLKDLGKPEGSFIPLMTAFADPSVAPAEPKLKATEVLGQLKASTGMSRLEYRWGFDDDALMSVTRLLAPAPRKAALAVLDQSPLDTQSLIPMPEGVDSFVMASLSPAKALEFLSQVEQAKELKQKVEELMEKVRSQSRVDFDKDFFSNLGPRMAVYLAPGRSAATTDEATQPPEGPTGFDLTAILSSLKTALPKPTLVAEVRDPVAFGKALDSIMITVNKELKAEAMEAAADEAKADDASKSPGQGQAPGRAFGRGPGGEGPGARPARKRSLKDTPSPEFRLMPGDVKIYMLRVPTDSPLKIVPPGVHPTIRLEGSHIAFSTSSEGARAALDTVKKKGWKPGPDVEQALSHLPSGPVLLAVADPREAVPSLLASLPGTLQARINSAIALSTAKSSGTPPAGSGSGQRPGMASPGQGVAPGPGGLQGPMGMSRPGSFSAPGPPGGSGGPPMSMSRSGYPGGSGPPGGSGFPGPGGPNNSSSASGSQNSMIVLKVDSEKLPKAEDLKALMFLTTFAVVNDDASVRLITRESFPSAVSGLGTGVAGSAVLAPAIQSLRAWLTALGATSSQAASSGSTENTPAAGQPPTPGQPAARPGGSPQPGGRRGPGRGGRPGGGNEPN